MISYAHCDPAKARDLESSLPALPAVNADTLENLPVVSGIQNLIFWSLKRLATRTYKPKPTVQSVNDTPIVKKPKKRAKRKNPPPKNIDPNKPADPERWLPKRERSGYKPIKKRG